MSIPFPGFTGASYHLQNRYASIERTVNFYLGANESPNEGKYKTYLEPSPGNQPFCSLPVPAPYNQPNRGLLELRGVVYGVNGNQVFTLDQNGNFYNVGTVANDGTPVSMVANGTGQVFIASVGLGYVVPATDNATDATGTLIPITTGAFLGAGFATFQDGYILVTTPNSNQFQISGSTLTPLGDATQWDAGNVSIQAGQADDLQCIISSREYLRLLGTRRSQIYYNSGNANFPFVSYNETFIETGIAAVHSLVEFPDSLVWIGQDARGVRACWRDGGFQPARISTFAIEQIWDGYVKVSDAIAFSYIWNGHLMYRITFPSAVLTLSGAFVSATWEYDATVSQLLGQSVWCERQFSDTQNNLVGRPELFHCFAYGLHLVGSGGSDGNPGAIYQMSEAPYTDCGVTPTGAQTQRPIVRDRIAPHVWESAKRIVINRIEYEIERGVALSGSPVVGADPQILQRWSKDGGSTWGPEQMVDAGQIGTYNQRVRFNRPIAGRDLVCWIRMSDPVRWSIIGAQLDIFETGV